jgi:hypothetical protein
MSAGGDNRHKRDGIPVREVPPPGGIRWDAWMRGGDADARHVLLAHRVGRASRLTSRSKRRSDSRWL